MSSRLDRIGDWSALAVSVHYSATALAHQCGVSPRHLERYFRRHFGNSPHHWLRDLRMKHAGPLMVQGCVLKQVALHLHYTDTAHFTRDFKAYYGMTPSRFLGQSARPTDEVAGQMSLFGNKCRF